MTSQQWYESRQGQSLLVPGQPADLRGQCAEAMNFARNEIYGLGYISGDALSWWTNPDNLIHFDQITDGSVKAGDFVVFNSQVGSADGHIDIAMSDGTFSAFQGADSNWGGNLTLHPVQHTNRSFIVGSLRFKGDNMQNSPNAGDVVNAYAAVGEVADQTDINVYSSKPWNAPDGLYYGKTLVDLKNLQDQLAAAQKPATVLGAGNYKVE